MTTTPTFWSAEVTFDPNPLAVDKFAKILPLADDSFILDWENGTDLFARHLDPLGSFTGGNFLSGVSGAHANALTGPFFAQQPDGGVIVGFTEATAPSNVRWHKANADFSPGVGDLPVVGAGATLLDVVGTPSGTAFLYQEASGAMDVIYVNAAGAPVNNLPVNVGIPITNGTAAPIFNGNVAVAYQRANGPVQEIALQIINPTAVNIKVVSAPGVSGDHPEVAVTNGGTPDINGDGSIVVVWSSATGLQFRRFTENGNPLDAAPRSIGDTAGALLPKVTALNDGGFMVVWGQAFGTETDGSPDFDLVVQRFDLNGTTVGDKVFIDNPGDQGGGMFNIATLDDGRVVLAFDNETGNATNLTTLDYVILDPRETTIDGSATADTIVGRLEASTISGLAGDDHLIGMDADDTLIGGAGNDQLEGGGGNDTASYTTSTAGVTVDLLLGTGTGGDAQGDTLVDIENLVGSAFADTLRGNDVVNLIEGGDGNDTLAGGLGNDTLTGGPGEDHFLFDTAVKKKLPPNVDTVLDFSVADDTIDLDNAIFKKLKDEGVLKKKFFDIGKKADDGNDYVLYNKKTGVLSYDKDGDGNKKAIAFADLDDHLKLTHDDFLVI